MPYMPPTLGWGAGAGFVWMYTLQPHRPATPTVTPTHPTAPAAPRRPIMGWADAPWWHAPYVGESRLRANARPPVVLAPAVASQPTRQPASQPLALAHNPTAHTVLAAVSMSGAPPLHVPSPVAAPALPTPPSRSHTLSPPHTHPGPVPHPGHAHPTPTPRPSHTQPMVTPRPLHAHPTNPSATHANPPAAADSRPMHGANMLTELHGWLRTNLPYWCGRGGCVRWDTLKWLCSEGGGMACCGHGVCAGGANAVSGSWRARAL